MPAYTVLCSVYIPGGFNEQSTGRSNNNLIHDCNQAGVEGIMGGEQPAKVMPDGLQEVSQNLLQAVDSIHVT